MNNLGNPGGGGGGGGGGGALRYRGGRTFVTYFAAYWGSKSPYHPRNIGGSEAERLPK